jgi:hypothetical protein
MAAAMNTPIEGHYYWIRIHDRWMPGRCYDANLKFGPWFFVFGSECEEKADEVGEEITRAND